MIMEPVCKCPSCAHSESIKDEFNLPYRYMPSAGLRISHLLLHFSVPAIGAILIGVSSWLALIPFAGFFVTYLVNSFWFCPGCSYHHEHAGLCGCFPRSIFTYKKNKPWGNVENIIGWPVLTVLMIFPSIIALYLQQNSNAIFYFLTYFLIGLIIHSIVSCPECRQRGVCYLGRTVIFLNMKYRE